MMSNLESARTAIEAELAQAKQGKAYYQAQVAALETTLGQLQNIGEANITAAKGVRAPKTEKTVPALKAKRGRPAKADKNVRPVKSTKGARDLPSTGGDYWQDLVTGEPRAAREVLKAAVDGLGFEPSPAQVKKLQQRMTFALNALVKDGKIQDSGSFHGRRFFK